MKKRDGYFLRLFRSFGFAIKGIQTLVTTQANARIHLLMTILVCGLGFYFDISIGEWVALLISISMVWVAEAINTAMEFIIDLVSPQKHPIAGKAKDLAAGAVLLAAFFSLLVGCLIFVPHFQTLICASQR